MDAESIAAYGTFELNMKLKEDIKKDICSIGICLISKIRCSMIKLTKFRNYTQGMSSPQTFCAISKPVGSCHANNSTLTPFRAMCAVLADSFPAWKRSDDTSLCLPCLGTPCFLSTEYFSTLTRGKKLVHSPAQTIALPFEPLIVTGNKSGRKPLYPALHTLQTKSASHSLNIMNIFIVTRCDKCTEFPIGMPSVKGVCDRSGCPSPSTGPFSMNGTMAAETAQITTMAAPANKCGPGNSFSARNLGVAEQEHVAVAAVASPHAIHAPCDQQRVHEVR